MRIRVTHQHPGEVDGISLSALQVGLTYDVSRSIATYLVTVGCAEPVVDTTPALVIPLPSTGAPPPSKVNLSLPPAVAADKGRRSDDD